MVEQIERTQTHFHNQTEVMKKDAESRRAEYQREIAGQESAMNAIDAEIAKLQARKNAIQQEKENFEAAIRGEDNMLRYKLDEARSAHSQKIAALTESLTLLAQGHDIEPQPWELASPSAADASMPSSSGSTPAPEQQQPQAPSRQESSEVAATQKPPSQFKQSTPAPLAPHPSPHTPGQPVAKRPEPGSMGPPPPDPKRVRFDVNQQQQPVASEQPKPDQQQAQPTIKNDEEDLEPEDTDIEDSFDEDLPHTPANVGSGLILPKPGAKIVEMDEVKGKEYVFMWKGVPRVLRCHKCPGWAIWPHPPFNSRGGGDVDKETQNHFWGNPNHPKGPNDSQDRGWIVRHFGVRVNSPKLSAQFIADNNAEVAALYGHPSWPAPRPFSRHPAGFNAGPKRPTKQLTPLERRASAPHKFGRVPEACQNCRAAHMACDKELPCGNCLGKGITCEPQISINLVEHGPGGARRSSSWQPAAGWNAANRPGRKGQEALTKGGVPVKPITPIKASPMTRSRTGSLSMSPTTDGRPGPSPYNMRNVVRKDYSKVPWDGQES